MHQQLLAAMLSQRAQGHNLPACPLRELHPLLSPGRARLRHAVQTRLEDDHLRRCPLRRGAVVAVQTLAADRKTPSPARRWVRLTEDCAVLEAQSDHARQRLAAVVTHIQRWI